MSLLEPYFGPAKAVVLFAVAAALFGAGWKANGWRLEGEVAEIRLAQADARAAAEETARLIERANTKRLEDARNEATKREAAVRRDADGARSAADGLRDELADLRRQLPDLSADSGRQRAAALADVLQQCADEYRGLAEKADRHASDVQTLTDAWPK